MKNRVALSFILFLSISFSLYGQQQVVGEYKFWDRVRFGGNIGGGFTNDFTSFIIAPQAIYQFNQYVGAGAGLTYSYSELDADRFDILDYSSNIYGASLIGIVNPIQEVQLSADLELLNVNRNFHEGGVDQNYWVPALFIGAGYRQGNVVFGIRYDVLFDRERSIFANDVQPFVRVMF